MTLQYCRVTTQVDFVIEFIRIDYSVFVFRGLEMGMDLSIYVGPYLKCLRKKGLQNMPALPDRLRDLVGEGDSLPFCSLIGPNMEIIGIERQLEFERTRTNAVTPIESIVREMALFESQFAHDIREIRGDYHSVEVCWGVVPGWF